MSFRHAYRIAIVVLTGCLFSAMANAQQENTLTQQEKTDGWQLLFDGKDFERVALLCPNRAPGKTGRFKMAPSC